MSLKNKIYKCLTAISKNRYIYTEIMKRCSHKNPKSIKMKSVDVKLKTYINFYDRMRD